MSAEDILALRKSWEESVLHVMRRRKKPVKDVNTLARLVCDLRKVPYTWASRVEATSAIDRMRGWYGATPSLKVYADDRVVLEEWARKA